MSFVIRIAPAIVFAVLWTAFMWWWSHPVGGLAHGIILCAIGTLVGLMWYWLSNGSERTAHKSE